MLYISSHAGVVGRWTRGGKCDHCLWGMVCVHVQLLYLQLVIDGFRTEHFMHMAFRRWFVFAWLEVVYAQ